MILGKIQVTKTNAITIAVSFFLFSAAAILSHAYQKRVTPGTLEYAYLGIGLVALVLLVFVLTDDQTCDCEPNAAQPSLDTPVKPVRPADVTIKQGKLYGNTTTSQTSRGDLKAM